MRLAARAGAYVIAAVGSAARGEGLPELGASEVVTSPEGVREFGAAAALPGRRVCGKALLDIT